MSVVKIFWAQALDNASHDHIKMNGRSLGPSEESERERAVSVVTRVVREGNTIFEGLGVRLIVDRLSYVLELPSSERDAVGRIAPIVCCGDSKLMREESFVQNILCELTNFAKGIARSVSSEDVARARKAFEELKKRDGNRWLRFDLALQ